MKRLLAIAGTLGVSLTLLGCPSGSVTTDYDHTVNFSQFHTFSFGPVQTDNPLFESRIRDQVSRDLTSKGLQQTQGQGDLVVTAVGAVRNRQQYQTFYNNPGFGYYYGGFGQGYSTTTVRNYKEGTLVLDLYNASTKHLVWRGIAKRGVSSDSDKNIDRVNGAIDKMLDDYPAH